MTNTNNAGNKRSESGGGGNGGGGNNRRRYFRRRKPSDKGQEPAKAESPKSDAPKSDAPKQTPPRPDSRKGQEGPPRGRTRNNGRAEFAGKGDRDRDRDRDPGRGRDRDRRGRRRRRSRPDGNNEGSGRRESMVVAVDHNYIPPKSVFVYTYVLRPGAPSLHEFRPEHFSRVGRRLEDFEIDLSPIFPVDGAPKKEARSLLEIDPDEDNQDYNYPDDGNDEEFPNDATDE